MVEDVWPEIETDTTLPGTADDMDEAAAPANAEARRKGADGAMDGKCRSSRSCKSVRPPPVRRAAQRNERSLELRGEGGEEKRDEVCFVRGLLNPVCSVYMQILLGEIYE